MDKPDRSPPREHYERLRSMLYDDGTWDLSRNDKAAIRWALSVIAAPVPAPPAEPLAADEGLQRIEVFIHRANTVFPETPVFDSFGKLARWAQRKIESAAPVEAPLIPIVTNIAVPEGVVQLRDASGKVLGEIRDAAPAEAPHPDDVAVDRFAAAMKAKLAQKRAEGYGGWDDKDDCGASFLRGRLRSHMEKGDPVDVGNFAMMLWNRGESTAAPAEAPRVTEGFGFSHRSDITMPLSAVKRAWREFTNRDAAPTEAPREQIEALARYMGGPAGAALIGMEMAKRSQAASAEAPPADEFDRACKAMARVDRPRPHGAVPLAQAITELGADLAASRERERALREALREECVVRSVGPRESMDQCMRCGGLWAENEAEEHKSEPHDPSALCLASPDSAAEQGEAKC